MTWRGRVGGGALRYFPTQAMLEAMKSIISATLSVTLALSALSAGAVNFSGSWVGTGTMTEKNPYTGNKSSPCSIVEVVLDHKPDGLTIQHYRGLCGQLDSDWGPSSMEIRGEKTFEEGEETGTLIGDTLKTISSSGGVQYAFNLSLRDVPAGTTPTLETYYGVRSMMGTIVIEGNLQPKR